MKTNRFQLPSRLVIREWLTITLITFLSLSPAISGMPREGSPGEVVDTSAVVVTSAPLATTIEVNTTDDGDAVDPSAGCDVDPVTPGEQCTLRAAIQRANALAGDDEIRFNIPVTEPNCDATSGSCIIYLTNALPPLGTNVRIEGPGSHKLMVRRSTGGDYRIFTVTSASAVTFSGLTISNGRPFGVSSGGAIANAGDATVNVVNSALSSNVGGADGGDGGAIANGGTGTINITNSIISDNTASVPVVDGANGGGGAIINASTGTVNVTNSIISQNKVVGGRRNSVMMGGGIYNASTGVVNVTNSAVSNNTVTLTTASGANGGGGGIAGANGIINITGSIISDNFVTGGDGASAAGIRGAGVLNASTGAMTVTGSVLFNNIVAGGGGGISNVAGSLNVTNSTITRNRGLGGIFGQGTVKSTIIAKNNLGPFVGSDVSGNFTSEGFNLVGIEDGSTGFNTPTDQKGTLAVPLDPKFDPNDVSVGVSGQSILVPGLPLCGSPAIDKGTSAGLTETTDLRGAGFPRTVDDPNESNAADGTDIGAFERESVCIQSVLTINATADTDDVSPGDGNCDSDAVASGAQCTLRAALSETNAVAGDYVINFAIPTNDPGFDPSTGRHTINLTGPLPAITNSNLTITGPGADKLTVRRNAGGFYRIFSFGNVVETVTISGLTIANGFSSGDGGGVSFIGQTLTINNCVFSDNTSAGSGGAIFATARLNVANSTFIDNFSSSTVQFAGGGAIHVRGALSVTDSTFNGNLASSFGGGINFQSLTGSPDSNITNSTFDGNGADAGGGLSVANIGAVVMTVNNSTFKRNTSTVINSKGGGIYHHFGTLNVIGSTLSNNEGFGVACNDASFITTNITDSTISGNTFGGIETEFAATPDGKLNVSNSTISGNTGGPGLSLMRVTLNVSNSTISHNEVGGIVKGISDNNGTWTVKSSIIAANTGGFGDVYGAFSSGGFNLIGNADLAAGFTNGVNNDQVGTAGLPLDPMFDAAGLRDNGGPTQTVALQPGSPAIDRGTADGLTGTLTADQRGSGFARTFDDSAVTNVADGTDVGAFELQPGGPSPTPTPTPSPSPGPSPSPSPSPSPTPTPAPSPSPSPSPTPAPQPAKLVITTTALVRTSCGVIVVGVTVQNIGGEVANNVRLTAATLSSPMTNGSPLPQSLGNLAPGQWATTVVTFSGANNPAGAKRTLRFDGTYSGGVFTDKWKVTLP